jgi:hypothetical protein
MDRALMSCYDRSDLFRPQWAFSEPDDSRDQLFITGPFSLAVEATGVLSLNLPVQLDDDVAFFIRAIYFGELSPLTDTISGNGALVRLRDCYGNMLTNGLIYALGAWGSAQDTVNAFGFVLEQEVECSPGGTLLFDFQLSSNGAVASATLPGTPGDMVFESAVMGAAGNGATITLVNPAAANVPLSVAVVGRAVTVTLSTNGASALTATFAQIAALLNTTPAVQAILFALIFSANPNQVATILATTPLVGGANGTPVTLQATLIGVKRFVRCAT